MTRTGEGISHARETKKDKNKIMRRWISAPILERNKETKIEQMELKEDNIGYQNRRKQT